MVLNHRSLRLLHSTVLASPSLCGPHFVPCNHSGLPQKPWQRCFQSMGWAAPLTVPHHVKLNSGACIDNMHKPPIAHPPASHSILAGMSHQCRFMVIRRKRRGATGPQKDAIQKLVRPVDEEINAETVRLVEGSSHMIISKEEAIVRARQQGLNLVQLDRQETQPVCRILDYRELQQQHEEIAEKKVSKAFEAEVHASKMKVVRVGWNIAPHDFVVKKRKLQEFLEKGKTVSVAVTYDHRPKSWQEQYPKAVEVSKQLWEEFRVRPEVFSWFDYSESGNKQVTIVYSHSPPTTSGKTNLLPWEPGSILPPFLIQMQQEAAAKTKSPGPARDKREGANR